MGAMASSSSFPTTRATTQPGAAGRGIRRLTGPVHARIVSHPASCPGFATIHVGDTTKSRSAREVQTTARLLALDLPETEHTPVAIEDDAGKLIGFITLRRKAFEEKHCPEIDITAYGRDLSCRGLYLRDGKTTVGEAVVIAGLEAVALAFEHQPMPRVWARVLSDNASSHRILEKLNFTLRPPFSHPLETQAGNFVIQEDQPVRVRPYTTPLPWPLDPEVYVPPEKPRTPFLVPLEENKHFPLPGLGRNDLCICGSGRKYKKCCEGEWPASKSVVIPPQQLAAAQTLA
jgi:SEC-C motif/Acetyltransferase (GNAT) domain